MDAGDSVCLKKEKHSEANKAPQFLFLLLFLFCFCCCFFLRFQGVPFKKHSEAFYF